MVLLVRVPARSQAEVEQSKKIVLRKALLALVRAGIHVRGAPADLCRVRRVLDGAEVRLHGRGDEPDVPGQHGIATIYLAPKIGRMISA